MKKALVLLCALCALASVQAQVEHTFSVSKNLDIFNSIYRQLDLFYVDSLDADKLVRVGVEAMLEELDPYTVYYPEEDMGDLKLMTTGKYGGIGSIIRMRKDSTVIIQEPYPNMPAAEAGLQVGDVLLQIDDKDLKGMTTSEVSDLLRGEPGTTFLLRARRPGEKKPREFKITRRSIKKSPIPYYGMRQGVGYICLSEFTEGCAKDMRKAFIELREQGAKGIIIDLRDNGGGLLAEAVDIVNIFVPKNRKVVETKGKVVAAASTYTTDGEPLDTIIPLAVLVNGNSASASEIVAGALQDFDRAVIVGGNTFGKGLVQSPRELPYNGSLKLTTAKYYIPSGRCIQAIDYKQRRQDAELYRATGKTHKSERDSVKAVFHTLGGREVTEGSGIKPDVETKRDTLSSLVYSIANADELIDWATTYFQSHPTIAPAGEFELTDDDFAAFVKLLEDKDFKYDRTSERRLEDLMKAAKAERYYDDAKAEFEALEKKLAHNIGREADRYRDDIRKLMTVEVVKRYYYQAGMIEATLRDDPDLAKAIEVISDTNFDLMQLKVGSIN